MRLFGWTLRVPILAAPPLATSIASSFSLGGGCFSYRPRV